MFVLVKHYPDFKQTLKAKQKVKNWFTDAAGIREDTPIYFTPLY